MIRLRCGQALHTAILDCNTSDVTTLSLVASFAAFSAASAPAIVTLISILISKFHEFETFIKSLVNLRHPMRFLVMVRIHPAFTENAEFVVNLGNLLVVVLVHK